MKFFAAAAVLWCLVLTATSRAAVVRRPAGGSTGEGPTGRPAGSDAPAGGLNGCIGGCRPPPPPPPRRRTGSPAGVEPDGEFVQLYVEKIKREILSQLGMAVAPNVSTASPVPENIPEPLRYSHEDEEDEEEEEEEETEDGEYDPAIHGTERKESHSKQIIVFGNEVELRRQKQKTIHDLRFSIPPTVPLNEVVSVELWLYRDKDPHSEQTNCTSKAADSTITVHLPKDDDDNNNNNGTRRPSGQGTTRSIRPLVSHRAPNHPGWFRVKLGESAEALLATTAAAAQTDRRLGVEHGDCVRLRTGPSHRAFLALRTRRRQRRRRRSSAARCQDGSRNCCRMHSLYINFREHGWNFIISPQGFEAKYCHGTCSVPSIENLVNTRRVHSTLLQKISRIQNNTDFLPCCAATSFSSLSLLYRGEDNVAIQENVPNVRVESCGCS